MTSLRRFLIVSVLASLALANFIAALHGYRASMDEAQQLFDRRLESTVQRLLAMPLPSLPLPPAPDSEDGVFQLIDGQGRLLWRSAAAPDLALTDLAPGFGETNFGGYRWRVLNRAAGDPIRRVIAAERTDLRYHLAESVVLQSVMPVLLALPFSGLLIWLIVGYGLKSLSELARVLKNKAADDFSPLSLPPPPAELVPVVDAINQSLRRLGNAFERERRFSADAAHELRTPISAIAMHLHNALADPENARTSLEKLQPDVQRLSHLVEQLLWLNRTSAEHYKMRFAELNLHDLAGQAIAGVYDDIEAKGQDIALLGDARSAAMQGEAFALGIVLENLLRNANKYCPKGAHIEVEVTGAGGATQLVVRDDGPGISEGDSARIFERFYRSGGDRHDSGISGCGLGLSIVQRIAELHGATVVSGRGIGGRGLSITLTFPKGNELHKVATV